MNAGPEVAEDESNNVGICAMCGRRLTQVGPNGECLRCLISLGFVAESDEAERSTNRSRVTPGAMKYDHFEVDVGPDGFPVELGAGAMAITYRARDSVLNSTVALKVIDRKVAQSPGARSRFLREAGRCPGADPKSILRLHLAAQRAQIDSKLLRFLIQVAALQAKRFRRQAHVVLAALQF